MGNQNECTTPQRHTCTDQPDSRTQRLARQALARKLYAASVSPLAEEILKSFDACACAARATATSLATRENVFWALRCSVANQDVIFEVSVRKGDVTTARAVPARFF